MATDQGRVPRSHARVPRPQSRESRPVLDLPDFLARPSSRHAYPLLRYRRMLPAVDLIAVSTATIVGYVLQHGSVNDVATPSLAYLVLGVCVVAGWLLALYVRGCYDARYLGVGPDEFDRLLTATVLLFAIVAGVGYLVESALSRTYVFVSLPLGLAFLVIGRWLMRRHLYRERAEGRACYRTIVLGAPDRVADLADDLLTDTYAGYRVVDTFGEPGDGRLDEWVASVSERVDHVAADAVAITPSGCIDAEAVRRLGWALEGRGIDLLVAPALSDVAGPRIAMRPAAGVPLIHLDEPGLSSAQRLAKRSLDTIGACVGLLVLAVPMAVVALVVRATSPGPALFRQWRVGMGGRTFRIVKFRTMTHDADAHRDRLRARSGYTAPAFKLADDPRVTRTGRFLRRWSIDEWPQLVNVLRGEMSLVGPRPHPIDDVARYSRHEYRRLLAKPGITGLWQVAGRSDLDWTEAIRLDLHYVENWSMTRDLVLIARTVRAVATGRGAR